MTPEQLSLIPTTQLEEELFRRFDVAVFHGRMNRPLPDLPGNHIKSWRHQGDPYTAIGLAYDIVDRCLEAVREQEESASRDEL